MLETLWLRLQGWLLAITDPTQIYNVLQALVLLVAGVLLARAARFGVERGFRHLAPQQRMLLRRGASYTVLGLFAVSAMRELGFDFGVLLGAAGIVTVAVGFASQTSASNLISGLFLVLERAVEVGDVVRVDGITGEILSVDLLSTKLRTFDNLLVRIPNETMVKSQITNLNRFPIRRIDLLVGVAYKEDLAAVRRVLAEVAERDPLILEEPAPMIMGQGFGDSSVNYQVSVWARRENFIQVRNRLQDGIKAAFDQHGIEIPFPQRSLLTGATTEPFPIRLIGGAAPDGAAPEPDPEPDRDVDPEPDPDTDPGTEAPPATAP